jgi:REP-associated tyrosine transposase
MSCYRRASIPGSSYFFTVVAYRRRPILCDEPIRHALRASIEKVHATRPFVINAWVLLPDHLHCILTLLEGNADFSTRWMMIKGFVSLSCKDDYHRADWMTASKRSMVNPPSGNDDFGNTVSAMKTISFGIRITFTSTR